jgi:hypothetical protein
MGSEWRARPQISDNCLSKHAGLLARLLKPSNGNMPVPGIGAKDSNPQKFI